MTEGVAGGTDSVGGLRFRRKQHAGSAGATAERHASETGTAATVLRRLLDHLVTIGVFQLDHGRYRPTELGDQLRDDGVKLQLDIASAGGRAEVAIVEFLHTIATGEPAYPRRYGATSGQTWTSGRSCAGPSTPR